MKCSNCGAALDLTMPNCPACGAEVPMGRLTGILGVVCRNCDAYNEPGTKTCASCGQPLAARAAAAPARPAGAEPGAPLVHTLPNPGSAPPPEETTIPLVTVCPSCGEDAGPGQFCASCGHALGTRGSQLMTSKPAAAAHGGGQGLVALEPGRAKLVLERGEGFDGATYRLNAAEVAAGRSHGAVLFPSDPSLAGHHATFFYRDGALHVRDEGAAGGIFVRLRGLSVSLKPGDLFALGDRLLRYLGPLPPPPAPPPDGTRRLGSPRPAGAAVLIEELLEGGCGGRVWLRAGPSVTLGRAGCSINLGDDPYLSQAHAELSIEADGTVKLRDLGSSNGTFVPIPPGGERELHDGDVVRMGREVLRVEVA